jgi:hypothetical protein
MGKETRKLIGSQLATVYKPETSSLPVRVVELLAQLAVAEAMAEYDRRRPAAHAVSPD